MKTKKNSLFQGKAMHPFIPLLFMVILCTVISYFVAPGAYDRETVNGVTRVIADSYHAVERTPVSLFQMFQSIPEGLTATANMMFCIMLIAGVVEIYKYTDVVGALINSVLKASKKFNSLMIIAIVMIVLFIFGGILGWSEHIIPFVPIIISLAISLGYDALVGMAISGFACLIAFASAPFNMFTVGTSHTIAELPMFSGWQLRIVSLFFICLLALLRYSREMDLMTFGEEQALSAGVDLQKVKFILIALSALMTGTAVSLAGVIGFVDLIAPHIVRRFFGSKHKLVVPASALFGGAFMVLADMFGRTILAPEELPVGAVTALIGAPFFAYIYFRRRRA